MEEFTPSRYYRALWKAARKIKNIDNMELIFDSLCNEVGISDPERDQARSEAGTASAQNRNSRDQGVGGKKV